jgi:UDP-N-acetylmuramoylalanine--D-glutamate ligase
VSERCSGVYLIGAAAERIEADLRAAWEAGIPHHRFQTLAEAVLVAADAARPGDVVLLAPACASFDAYRDFEARGEHFRELVEGLR